MDTVHALVITARIEAQLADELLTHARNRAHQLDSSSDWGLAIVTDEEQLRQSVSTGARPTQPPTNLKESRFERSTIQDVASQVTQLSGRMYNFFALIDQQTANDRATALLVSAQTSEKNSNECTLDTVRVYMTEAQIALAALKLGSLGFEEIKSQAERNGGVYGSPPPGQPSKGMPAPRKQLGT